MPTWAGTTTTPVTWTRVGTTTTPITWAVTGTTIQADYTIINSAPILPPVTWRDVNTNGTLRPPATIWRNTTTEEFRQERQARAIARERARERARDLLMAHLDDVNRDRLCNQSYIEITGSDGLRYQIEIDTYAGNVLVIDHDGRAGARLCGHGPPELPIEDHVLAQMLMITTDAERFRALAHAS